MLGEKIPPRSDLPASALTKPLPELLRLLLAVTSCVRAAVPALPQNDFPLQPPAPPANSVCFAPSALFVPALKRRTWLSSAGPRPVTDVAPGPGLPGAVGSVSTSAAPLPSGLHLTKFLCSRAFCTQVRCSAMLSLVLVGAGSAASSWEDPLTGSACSCSLQLLQPYTTDYGLVQDKTYFSENQTRLCLQNTTKR